MGSSVIGTTRLRGGVDTRSITDYIPQNLHLPLGSAKSSIEASEVLCEHSNTPTPSSDYGARHTLSFLIPCYA